MFSIIEENLRKKIRELETEWLPLSLNDRGSDATTATVNTDEKWIAVLHRTLEELAD